ncbi:universal stress protein [Pseudonocardia xishanensis]|uniref:Universal stress protein n=1 Tax=Pseudonocardia xishanensis TaxID=630995 RepID=A0ABP8RTB6_9PSEU
MSPVVLVGVDGDAPALVAVSWAAREAARRGAVLRLLTVTPWAADPIPSARVAADGARAARLALAEVRLSVAAARAAEHLPEVRIERSVREGVPAEELGRASEQADLLVIGGPVGGWAGTMLGVALAGRARCPLVVVERPGHPSEDGGIVAGLDGAEDGDAALAVAFREATERGLPLEIVHAWSDAPLDAGTEELDFAAFAPDVRRVLDARIAPLRRAYPAVRLRHTVVRDRPERALVQASKGAHLVVLGARGRSSVIGLGEVGRRVVLLAECPVAIVGPLCRSAEGRSAEVPVSS